MTTLKAKDSDAVHPKDTPLASQIMNRQVRTIDPKTPLADVASFLLKHEISNVPVVRRDNDVNVLLGFISEADCLRFLANELFYGDPSPPQLADTIMTRHPICVRPDDDVFTLASIFSSHGLRHVPVVDGEVLLGIVSRRDVIKELDRYYREWLTRREHDRFPVNLHNIMNLRFLTK